MTEYQFVRPKKTTGDSVHYIPNYVKFTRTPDIEIGDEVIIPIEVSAKDKDRIWESGCKSLDSDRSKTSRPFGLVVAGRNDAMVDALGYNRRSRGARYIQALMPLWKGSKVYFGYLDIRGNDFAPKMKVYRMEYRGSFTDAKYPGAHLGRFEIKDVLNDYSEVRNHYPATRLVSKLFQSNVKRPYYANCWGQLRLDIEGYEDRLKDWFENGLWVNPKHRVFSSYESLIDAIEDECAEIAGTSRPRPVVAQIFDFFNETMELAILHGVNDGIKNLPDTLVTGAVYTIRMSDIDPTINPFLTYKSDSVYDLEFMLKSPNKQLKTAQLSHRTWVTMRVFKA